MWYVHPAHPLLKFKYIHYKEGIIRLHIYSLRSGRKVTTLHCSDAYLDHFTRMPYGV